MATAKITIVDNKFESYDGRYLEYIDSDHVIGNGWECWFEDNGSLRCEASREYADGRHTMLYSICPNGFSKQVLMIKGKKPKVIKAQYVVGKGQSFTSGLLGLSGGRVDDRYAYFRNAEIQKFLDSYGITAVNHSDPNQVFSVRSAKYDGGEAIFSIWTDGKKKKIEVDSGRTESWKDNDPNTFACEYDVKIHISNATWTVVEQDILEGNQDCYSKILYTQAKDITSLDLSSVLMET